MLSDILVITGLADEVERHLNYICMTTILCINSCYISIRLLIALIGIACIISKLIDIS